MIATCQVPLQRFWWETFWMEVCGTSAHSTEINDWGQGPRTTVTLCILIVIKGNQIPECFSYLTSMPPSEEIFILWHGKKWTSFVWNVWKAFFCFVFLLFQLLYIMSDSLRLGRRRVIYTGKCASERLCATGRIHSQGMAGGIPITTLFWYLVGMEEKLFMAGLHRSPAVRGC